MAEAGAGVVSAFGSRTWAWAQPGAGERDARLPRARHWLWGFAVGNVSAVPAPWDSRLGCRRWLHGTPGWCAGLAGAEGRLPWHGRTGAGRIWVPGAALTPQGPPAAPRLPNSAAESGQLLRPCPRSAALLSLSRCPWKRGSAPGCCSGCGSDLEMPHPLFPQDPPGPIPPALCSGLACPCAAQPGAQPWHRWGWRGDVGCPPCARRGECCEEPRQPAVR